MLKLKIPISKICQELHVSRPLIYKAIAKYGINYKYTALNPDELLVVDVRDLSSNIPHVQVPDVESPMSDSALRTLRDNIDPLSGDDGKEIYRRVVQWVGRNLMI